MREFYRQREAQLVVAPVSLNGMADEVLSLTRARWSDMPLEEGIVVDANTEYDPDLPNVLGVESEIREVLTNLVLNAVDAMPNGGNLTLKTTHEGSQVMLEVIDTGVGMDDDTRRRCLEPFFTTKGERGTGLGLSMVYGIVQRHGADIEIESEPGKGTTMRLVFSVSPAGTAGEAQTVWSRSTITRRKLLVVDDDPLILKSLCETLETQGHFVSIANGGQAGIDAFTASVKAGDPFPVVITDLGMPTIDGRKLAAAVKDAVPSTYVILLTGWGQRLVNSGDVPLHVDCVLSKPPKLRELNEALSTVSESRDGAEA
jgi:CheY-like chemotaxis protein